MKSRNKNKIETENKLHSTKAISSYDLFFEKFCEPFFLGRQRGEQAKQQILFKGAK